MNYLKTFLPYLFGNKKGKSLEVSIPEIIPWDSLNFEEILMFHALRNSLDSYLHSIDLTIIGKKDLFQLFNFLPFLNVDLRFQLECTFKEEYKYFLEATQASVLNKNELQELLNFKNNKLTLFAILDKKRSRPGLLIIRKANGYFLKNDLSNIWSIPVLGLSGRGLPFHHTNGQTPTGVFTLDSVMPEANNPYEFGKFRRLIVNFIPKSLDESDLTALLPSNHQNKSWWKASVVARELGRSLLRIHGTGRSNLNPFSSYFPFVPTSGCLATKEGDLLGLKRYNDQRLLLDSLQKAMNLPVFFENESKIHGLLYVVEFDDNLSALHFVI
jgi:hypothetical protein